MFISTKVYVRGDSMELYKRIKKRRIELGLSQEELAKRLGYKSRSSINKIELGENDIPQSKIAKFAKALETTEVYLLGFEDDPDPSLAELSSTFMRVVEKASAEFNIPLTKAKKEILSVDEYSYISTYRHLNKDNQSKAASYAESLLQIQTNEEMVLNAANAIPNASTEDKQHDDDIMNDENF